MIETSAGVFEAEPGEIFGWFDWQPYCDAVVASAPRGAVLVELGVFLGKSLAYLARKAKEADKGLRVVGVDTFRGSPEFAETVFLNGRSVMAATPGTLAQLCMEGLDRAGVLDDVTLVVGDSARSAKLFGAGSVWSVFVDAGHDEADVRADVRAWRPKLAPGGWMGGHDYHEPGFPGVKAVVDEYFPRAVVTPDRSWWEVRL